MLRAGLCRRIGKVTTSLSGLYLSTASAQPVEPLGACTARVVIAESLHVIEFVVLPSCSHDVILGWDFLSSNNAIIDCARAEVELSFPSAAAVDQDPVTPTKMLVAEVTDIPPQSAAVVSVSCVSARDATVLFTPCDLFARRRSLPLPFAVIAISAGRGVMCVCNVSFLPVTLHREECLGYAQIVDSSMLFDAPDAAHSTSLAALDNATRPPLECFHPSISGDLTTTQRAQLVSLLREFTASFDCHQHSLGRTTTVSHSIDTGSHAPLRQRPYRVSASERRVIDEQVSDMLRRGVIQPSHSPWASPIVLVKKKDGSIRFCVDYRRLNKITRKDVYPLPRIDDALDCLQGAEFFSSLDLRSGYWQVPMTEADRSKTAFVTPDGLYEFNVMPFGLCNAPATFERMMDSILRGLKWHTCLCYLDDVVVFSRDFSTQLQRLRRY